MTVDRERMTWHDWVAFFGAAIGVGTVLGVVIGALIHGLGWL